MPECANTFYSNILVDILLELAKLKELDDSSFDLLIDTDFNQPDVRFTVEDFKWMPVTPDQRTYVTQELNEFLENIFYWLIFFFWK